MYKRINVLLSLLKEKQKADALSEIEAIQYFNDDDIFKKLYTLISMNNFDEAIQICNEYLKNIQKPDFHDNIDIIGLQTTYQMLHTQYLVLNSQKLEAEKLIAQFRVRYYKELGFLISDILRKRVEIFASIRDTNPDANYEYEKTQQQYNNFNKNWEHVPKENQGNISEEERQRLIIAYRKASKLCHPDAVIEEQKDAAAEIFVKLNKAYFENDVSTVESILQQLEHGLLVPDQIAYNDKKALKARIAKLKQEIDDLKKDFSIIKDSQTYQFIARLENWDEYFQNTRKQLEKELEELYHYEQAIKH